MKIVKFKELASDMLWEFEDLIETEMGDQGDTCEYSQKICVKNALKQLFANLNGVVKKDLK